MEEAGVYNDLNAKIGARPSMADLEKQNVIPNKDVAPAIAGAAASVEKSMQRRQSRQELQDRGILTDMNPEEYAEAKNRERRETEKLLEGRMARRPEAAALESRNILYDQRVDPSLHASAIALRKEQIAKNLASSMSNRPENPNMVPYMEHKNVVPEYRGVAYDLNNQLQSRPSVNEVSHLKQDYSTQAPSLQPAGYAVSKGIANRPTYEELQRRGVVGVGERISQNTQALVGKLGRRQSRQEVSNMIPHSNVAPKLQGAAYDLQNQLQFRQKKDLKPEFAKGDMAQAMQPAAYELNKKLNRRMSRDDLATRGYLNQRDYTNQASQLQQNLQNRPNPNQVRSKYMPYGDLSGAIQASAYAVEDKLKARPSQQQVQYFSEDASRQAPAIQRAGASISKKLARRPSKAELEAQNILARMNRQTVQDRAGDLSGVFQNRPNQLPATMYQDNSHIQSGHESKERFRRNSNAVGDWLTSRPDAYNVPNKYFVDASANKKRGSTEFKENEFESAWEKQFTTARPSMHDIPAKYFREPALQYRTEAQNLERGLKRRPTLDQLQTRGLITDQKMAPALQAAALQIKDKIGRAPTVEEMMRAGFSVEYLMGKQAASIQPSSKRVSNFLNNRVSEEELRARGILRDQGEKSVYERQSQMIQPMFGGRKERSEIDQKILTGGVDPNVSRVLAPAAFQLEKKLRNRRQSQDLINQNILKVDPKSDNRLAMYNYNKEQKEKRQNLEKSLKRRMSIDDLQAKGIFKGEHIHDSLAGRRQELQQGMLKRDLNDKIGSRPVPHAVPSKYFIEPKRKGRGKKKRRQSEAFKESASQLEQMVAKRPMPYEVNSKVFQKPSQVKEARMSIAGAIGNRMSPEEMQRRGLLPHNYNDGFAPVDMAIFDKQGGVKNKLEEQLKARPNQRDIQKQGYIMQENMAHGLQPAAHQLARKLDPRRRMSVDDLASRNILKSAGVAPRLQQQMEDLEKGKLYDSLNSRISMRPDRDTLVSRGIVDKRNLTPAQYEAQKQLEMQMRRHRMEDMLASKRSQDQINHKVFEEPRGRRGRGMSVSMQNSRAHLAGLLQNRPEQHEVSTHVFQAPNKRRRMSVEMENIARKMESKLANRPARDEISQDVWITAKDARGHNGRRVSHAMKQNQDILAQLLRSKQDYDSINESVFRVPSTKQQLSDKLQRRMSRQDLMDRGILNQYANNRQLAMQMTQLDKNLGRRPTIDQLQSQNILHQGYGFSMDAEMANKKRMLDQQLLENNLSQRLLNRPDKSELAAKGYLDDSGLAPMLHPTALSLNQKLVEGTRLDRDELIRRGIITDSSRRMSRTLAPIAHQLERKLKRRMSIDDLANRNILDNSGKAPRVVAAHKDLQRERRASRVDQMLQHRPDINDLKKKGIYANEKVAPKLQGAARNIAKHLTRRPSQVDVAGYMVPRDNVTSKRYEEDLEDFLAVRPLPSDLKRQGYLPGVPVENRLDDYRWLENREEYMKLERRKHQQELSARQQASGEWIEMKPTTYRRDSMTQRNDVQGIGKTRMRRMSKLLDSKLRARPAMSDLADRGLLDDSGLAPRLHPTALEVQQNLTSRMSREELIARGILPDQGHHVSNQLSGRVEDLGRKMGRRPTLSDLAGAGYVSQQYAQQYESKQDKRRRVSVALEHKLRYRPSKETLADQGILDDSDLAPSLHATAIDLQTRLIQQRSRAELQARGILTSGTDVSRVLQGTRNDLEAKMKRRMSRQDMTDRGILDNNYGKVSAKLAGAARNVSKALRRRPSIDDLRSKNILSQYDQSMPPEMIEQAKQKNRAVKSARIKDMFESRPSRDQVGSYKNFAVNDVANSLQGAGHAVAKMLKRRPSVDILQARNILHGDYNMDPEAARRAHELGFQQRRDTISQFMGRHAKEKKQKLALEDLGLPTNIATEDHIKRVLDMNAMILTQMQQMQEQLNVLQMTCTSLVQERDQWKNQVKSLARQNTQELEMMKEYLRDTLRDQQQAPPKTTALSPPVADGARGSFRSELRDFKEQVVGMQEQARQYLLNERERFQVKESAFKAHMLESDIQITRLQGEYEFTISAQQAGLKFESCDNGRNLCVKAVLKGSQPEQNGVMPGDVIITIRNPKENRVRRVENQDAQVTLELFRNHPRPMIVKFRKYEAHHQLRDLWRRKRELLENVPSNVNAYSKPQHEPGAKPSHKRRNSNLFHETDISRNGITQDDLNRKREMEEALLQLKNLGHTDPIVRAFEEMDENQNGDLNEEEFVKGLYKIGIGEGLTAAQMKHVFKVLDDDHSGYIDYNEFEDFLKHGQNDPICEFVQRHIRDRIARLITQNPKDRVVE